MSQAVSYSLKISTTAMFTRTVKEATGVTGTGVDITGLDGGDYFWDVTATNAKKETSEVSETFRFTLVAQGKTQDMALEITGTPDSWPRGGDYRPDGTGRGAHRERTACPDYCGGRHVPPLYRAA